MTAINHGRLANNQVGQLVRAPKTSELIAAQLRRQIVRGAVKPGEGGGGAAPMGAAAGAGAPHFAQNLP